MKKKKVFFGRVPLWQYECQNCKEWQFEAKFCSGCGALLLEDKKEEIERTEYRTELPPTKWLRKVSVKTRQVVYERDNFICQYCGRHCYDSWITDNQQLTLDHLVPITAGGTFEEINLITCCRECNSIKGNKRFKNMEDARDYILKQLNYPHY